MNYWYKGQEPDLYLKFGEVTIGVHHDLVKSIPYFAELIELNPAECKDVVEIPMSPGKALMYFEHIYSQHRSLEDKLEMLKAGHYFGDGSVDQLFPHDKSYSDTDRVLILNAITGLTNCEKYQRMFIDIMTGYGAYCGAGNGIYHDKFFEGAGVNLTRYAFQDIIRCNPSNPIILYGLLCWETYHIKSPMKTDLSVEWDEYDTKRSLDFKTLIRKMDYSEMKDIGTYIKELINSCSDPEYLRTQLATYYPPVPEWVGPQTCSHIQLRGMYRGLPCGRPCMPGQIYCSSHRNVVRPDLPMIPQLSAQGLTIF